MSNFLGVTPLGTGRAGHRPRQWANSDGNTASPERSSESWYNTQARKRAVTDRERFAPVGPQSWAWTQPGQASGRQQKLSRHMKEDLEITRQSEKGEEPSSKSLEGGGECGKTKHSVWQEHSVWRVKKADFGEARRSRNQMVTGLADKNTVAFSFPTSLNHKWQHWFSLKNKVFFQIGAEISYTHTLENNSNTIFWQAFS